MGGGSRVAISVLRVVDPQVEVASDPWYLVDESLRRPYH